MHDQWSLDFRSFRDMMRTLDDSLGVRFALVEHELRMLRSGGSGPGFVQSVERLQRELASVSEAATYVRDRLDIMVRTVNE